MPFPGPRLRQVTAHRPAAGQADAAGAATQCRWTALPRDGFAGKCQQRQNICCDAPLLLLLQTPTLQQIKFHRVVAGVVWFVANVVSRTGPQMKAPQKTTWGWKPNQKRPTGKIASLTFISPALLALFPRGLRKPTGNFAQVGRKTYFACKL